MKLYHGSMTAGIQVLEPQQADHDQPYIYLTAIEAVAAIYLCNGAEPPYYWFPYGFDKGGDVPIYNEIYPNALRDVSRGVKGYIYEVEAEESALTALKGIPCAKLAKESLKVTGCREILDVYALFQEYIEQGKMRVGRFEDKTEKQLEWWYNSLAGELREQNMVEKPDCSYALFIKKKLPQVWERYLSLIR